MRNILWAFLLAPLPAWAGEPAAIHIKVETSALSVSDCAATGQGSMPKHAFFQCEVTNVSDVAISALTRGVTIYEPGRTIQWMPEEEHGRRIEQNTIRGGIEPGESMTFTLRFLSLPNRADPSKIEFTMHFTQAFDANGNPIQ